MLPGLMRPFLMRSDTDIFLPVGHAVHTGAVAGGQARTALGGWWRNAGLVQECRWAAKHAARNCFNKALCTRVQAVVATSY